MTRKPVAHFLRPDGTERPIYSWEMVEALTKRDDLRDRVLIDFDAWFRAWGATAA
jgi:hypothetical protein